MPENPVLERVLFSEEQITKRVAELGRQISADYRGKQPLFVGILRGCILFYSDLMKTEFHWKNQFQKTCLLLDFLNVDFWEYEKFSGFLKFAKTVKLFTKTEKYIVNGCQKCDCPAAAYIHGGMASVL